MKNEYTIIIIIIIIIISRECVCFVTKKMKRIGTYITTSTDDNNSNKFYSYSSIN